MSTVRLISDHEFKNELTNEYKELLAQEQRISQVNLHPDKKYHENPVYVALMLFEIREKRENIIKQMNRVFAN